MRQIWIAILSVLSLFNVILLYWLVPAVLGTGGHGNPTELRGSLKAAMELGRLDMVTVILSVLAVILVFGGLFSYFKFELMAEREAKKEARKRVDELLPEMVPELVAKHMSFLSSQSGDAIAQHVDPENEDG